MKDLLAVVEIFQKDCLGWELTHTQDNELILTQFLMTLFNICKELLLHFYAFNIFENILFQLILPSSLMPYISMLLKRGSLSIEPELLFHLRKNSCCDDYCIWIVMGHCQTVLCSALTIFDNIYVVHKEITCYDTVTNRSQCKLWYINHRSKCHTQVTVQTVIVICKLHCV